MEITQRNASRKFTAGDLREQVQFRMPIKGLHSQTNEEVRTYVTSNAIRAAVEYSTASGENEVATRKTSLVEAVFVMYFREAVRPTWRIQYRDAEYEIESILPDARRFLMRIKAVQREPWQDEYLVSESEGFWTDASGNFWVVTQRGVSVETQPTFGNLTWTDSSGNTWTTT